MVSREKKQYLKWSKVKQGLCVAIFGFSATFTQPVLADSRDNWVVTSDITAYGLVTVAIAWPAYQGDWKGFRQASYSTASSTLLGEIGKAATKKERPDGSDDDSFPSNHTANAFAAATTMHIRYGWEVGVPAYGVAALAGYSRVQANKHYWVDVAAGAALGIFTGWLFTDALNESVHIHPWVEKNDVGLHVSVSW